MPAPIWKKPVVNGKSLDALADSRDGHAKILSEFGTLPQSIMVHDKSKKAIDLMATKRSYESTFSDTSSAPKSKAFQASGSGCATGALSRFPQNIGRSLLLLYTKKNRYSS